MSNEPASTIANSVIVSLINSTILWTSVLQTNSYSCQAPATAKLADDVYDEKYPNEKDSRSSTSPIAPLGAPLEDKSGLPWWQRFKRTKVDLNTIATQESVYDDPVIAKYYQPRSE